MYFRRIFSRLNSQMNHLCLYERMCFQKFRRIISTKSLISTCIFVLIRKIATVISKCYSPYLPNLFLFFLHTPWYLQEAMKPLACLVSALFGLFCANSMFTMWDRHGLHFHFHLVHHILQLPDLCSSAIEIDSCWKKRRMRKEIVKWDDMTS